MSTCEFEGCPVLDPYFDFGQRGEHRSKLPDVFCTRQIGHFGAPRERLECIIFRHEGLGDF